MLGGVAPARRPPFTGIVLTGGSSRRMGADKALLEVRGRPLAAVARDALLRAGAVEVLAVGGDADRLAGLGLRPVPDRHPGQGPLGGLVSGLAAVRTPVAVALACDLPAVDAATVRRVLHALVSTGGDVAVPVLDRGREPLAAAWTAGAAQALADAYDGGERSVARALAPLRVVEVRGLDPVALADADEPGDLARYAAG